MQSDAGGNTQRGQNDTSFCSLCLTIVHLSQYLFLLFRFHTVPLIFENPRRLRLFFQGLEKAIFLLYFWNFMIKVVFTRGMVRILFYRLPNEVDSKLSDSSPPYRRRVDSRLPDWRQPDSRIPDSRIPEVEYRIVGYRIVDYWIVGEMEQQRVIQKEMYNVFWTCEGINLYMSVRMKTAVLYFDRNMTSEERFSDKECDRKKLKR